MAQIIAFQNTSVPAEKTAAEKSRLFSNDMRKAE